MSNAPVPAHLASSPKEYALLGLKRGQVEPWEDGLRTDGGKGTYEWWYFDAHLHDGSKLVIVFHTKDLADVDKPLKPSVEFRLDRPDGTHIEQETYLPAALFSASKTGCDVRIGANTFTCDLHTCRIHVETKGIGVDLTLTGTVPPWRPETGFLLFGAQGEYYFAWLPSVPQGEVTGTLTLAGNTEAITGIGYHDHNWGNISLLSLINNWYWARGKIGSYTVIASYITTEQKYGYQPIPVFMLAKDGVILADDASKVQFAASDIHPDAETGKPVAEHIVYDYRGAEGHYVLTFQRRQTILRIKLVETIKGIKRYLARLIGFDGAFLRFTGDLTIDRYAGDAVAESYHDEAIWELAYFGKVPKG